MASALMLVGLADEWFTFLPAGALEAIRADLDLTYAQVGLTLTALSAGGLLGFFFEVAVDYVSRRWLSALGAVAYGGAMIAFGLADSFWVLIAAAFVWGAASDAFTHASDVALVEIAGDEQVLRALSRQNAWAAVGDLLGPAALALILGMGWNWRLAFLGGGGVMLVYAAWLAAHRFPAPRPPLDAQSPVTGVAVVLRDRRVWLMAILMGLFALLDEPLLGFAIAYIEHSRPLTAAGAPLLATGAIWGGVIGYAVADRLAPRASLRAILLAAALGMTIALPAMIFSPWSWTILLGGVGFGLSGAVFYTRLQAAIMTLRPGQAGATGAVVSAIGLVGMGFPALAGEAADTWGLGAGIGLYLAVPAAIALLIAAFRTDPTGA